MVILNHQLLTCSICDKIMSKDRVGSLQEYLARSNETIIKFINSNQEMLVGFFQNGLKAGHFNVSLSQKPIDSMK